MNILNDQETFWPTLFHIVGFSAVSDDPLSTFSISM